jgi:hypothetical protein
LIRHRSGRCGGVKDTSQASSSLPIEIAAVNDVLVAGVDTEVEWLVGEPVLREVKREYVLPRRRVSSLREFAGINGERSSAVRLGDMK